MKKFDIFMSACIIFCMIICIAIIWFGIKSYGKHIGMLNRRQAVMLEFRNAMPNEFWFTDDAGTHTLVPYVYKKTYSAMKEKELKKYYDEYYTPYTAHRFAIKFAISNQYAHFDESKIGSDELRNFLIKIRGY